ncbi:hypothetical protein BO443_60039 [Burkholderia orbicola]
MPELSGARSRCHVTTPVAIHRRAGWTGNIRTGILPVQRASYAAGIGNHDYVLTIEKLLLGGAFECVCHVTTRLTAG